MPIVTALSLAADLHPAYFLAPVGAVVALVMAFVFSKSVMQRSEGDDEMIRIAQAVRDGAMAYLTRQYKVVTLVFVMLLVFLGIMVALGLQETFTLIGVPVAGLFSGLCGWFGMKMATNASARTTFAAKESLNEGLTVAFRSGAVMGLVVVGFALLDVSLWYAIFNLTGLAGDIQALTTVMLSFGMGASTQALFARVGGGIYTKAADVGADLVGKVEAGIPEDDPRNPATIADNVGDNVGDVAGMGADLYESYYGSILATMALGAAAAFTFNNVENQTALALALTATPLALAGAGIFCSVIGIFSVKAEEGASFSQLLKGLHMGVYIASAIVFLAAVGILYFTVGMFDAGENVTLPFSWLGLVGSILTGLVAGNVIAYATEYYTSYEHRPTQRIAEQALTGPATVIISGIAEGMKSTWASLLTVVVAILLAFICAGGADSFLMGLYGVGIAAVGMLSTLGITLATDAYGPIADNAGGNAEMTSQPPHVRERTDMLDSLGNTTAAVGKGFAIGSAALTALALFAAFVQVVEVQIDRQAANYAIALEQEGTTLDIGQAIYRGHGQFVIRSAEGDEGLHAGLLDSARSDDAVAQGLVNSAPDGTLEIYDFAPQRAGMSIESAKYINVMVGDETSVEVINAEKADIEDILTFYDVTLTNPALLGGVFIGVLLTFLFCALTMNAVGRAAYSMIDECRRQFGKIRESLRAGGMSEEDVANPDNWPKTGVDHEGTHYPDYASCVSISTAGAQKEMVVPAALAIIIPILVGLTLNVPGVMGMLAGGLTCGFAVAIFMANAGGAWDNAKKLLESYGRITANDMVNNPEVANKVPEAVRDAIRTRAQDMIKVGNGDDYVYGKGSEDHKATVVGDTVGDPFKDTSGPSLNILIKLISVVSVVFAGLTVAYGPIVGSLIGLN
ncbi:MAG: sodium-translocating pyrophosphatase [Planctomycetota bacterium]